MPTFIEEDMLQKITQHCQGRFYWSPCIKMFRREFLIENQIKFPRMAYYEDLVFCFKCLCLAKNYVRVPNVANIIRIRHNSASQQTGEPQQVLERWLNVVIEGTKTIDEFMNVELGHVPCLCVLRDFHENNIFIIYTYYLKFLYIF